MKKIIFLIFAAPMLGATQNARTPNIVSTFLDPRSTSDYHSYTLMPLVKKSEWLLQVVGGTNRSFWPNRINRNLFGEHCESDDRTFIVSGSRAANRGTNDWLADYFGLPTDFVSIIRTLPRAKNHLILWNGVVPLTSITPGLYAYLHVPFVYTDWDMKLAEKVKVSGDNGYDPGYFNANGASRAVLLSRFTDFITGEKTPSINGLTFQPLQYAKINPCPQKRHTFTEITVGIGYDLYSSEIAHATIAAHFAIPAGTRPHGVYLFEPVTGNGHHWQLGMTAAGFWRPVTRWTPDIPVTLSIEFSLDHLFSARQHRTFDLKHKPLSRYMLATKLSPSITDNLQGDVGGSLITPVAQFQHIVAPVANLTHLEVNVSAAYQLQLTLAISYEQRGWNWTFGYNLWQRARSTITQCGITPLDTELWALKGDAHVIGFEQNPPTNPAINLSASQSNATINAGTNFPARGATLPEEITAGIHNPGIDHPAPARADSDNTGTKLVTTQPGGDSADVINTSIQPIILKKSDIDIENNNTKNTAHTFFTQTLYTWHNTTALTPYFGVGAQIESGFTRNRERCHTLNCALAYWGVWIKIGCSYS